MHRGALDAVLLAPLVVDKGLFEAAACGMCQYSASEGMGEKGQGKRGLQASRTAARLKAISGSSGWREAATL